MTNFKIDFSHPWLLLLLAPALALTLIPYFRSKRKYRRNRNRIVSVSLHAVIMTLLVLLIAGTTFSYDVPNEQNELILLVDASYSGAETQETKDGFVRSVLDECNGEFKTGVVKFGYDQVYAAPLSSDTDAVFDAYLASDDPDTSATDVAAALRYAQTLFSHPQAGKIVLLSDGIETDENALSVIKSIAAEGVKVDTAYFPNAEHDEVQIVGVKTPEYNVNVGDDFFIELTVRGNAAASDGQLSVTVYDNDTAGEKQTFSATAGVQTLKVKHRFDLPGEHALRFAMECGQDTVSQNNVWYSYVNIRLSENILIIEKDEGEADALKTMLETDYEVTSLSIEADMASMPANMIELCEYRQVILANISNGDLATITREAALETGFDELLHEYVYTVGGGVLTVGGRNDPDGKPHAYNRDDMMSGSAFYRQMLPVQVVRYTPPVAVMIIVDSSGSMGSGEDSPMHFAKQGAMAVFDVLNPRDYCGIMTLDDDPTELIQVTQVSHKYEIETAINRITAEGQNGTVYTTSIQRAGAALAGVNVQQKHIILVTDGQPNDSENFFGEAIRINRENGITMSIVSIGTDGQLDLMKKAAEEYGGGKFYNPVNVEDIAVQIKNDLTTEAVAEIAYGEPFSLYLGDLTPAVAGIRQEDLPKIYGYYGTQAKEGAQVPLWGGLAPSGENTTAVAQRVPVYAQHKYGEGTVGSFMCDVNGNWSKDFMESAAGQRFINNVITGLFPTKDIRQNEIKVVLREDNYTDSVNVYTDRKEGDTLEVKVTPVTEEAIDHYRQNPVAVTAAEGDSRFTFSAVIPGIYEIVVRRLSASGDVTAELTLHKILAYSAEYDMFPEREPIGAEYLAALAKNGKGVVIEDVFDVFDSFERARHRVYDPRMAFLIAAIVAFLLDIAVRKFKFKWPHELIRDYREKKALKEDRKEDGQRRAT